MRKGDLPPLETLRAFDAAARQLSFTRAAEELFVTQSAVSKQVIALESALGTRLFERKARALALTPAGERLRRSTEAAFAELRAAAAELRGGGEPTVTLATTQAFASFWLIPRLADFRRGHPGIDIRISADTRVVDLERGRFDAAVRYLQDRNAPATALRLFGDTTLPVLSPALLKKSARPLRKPVDLAHYVLLASLALVADLLAAGKLVAPLPQRFANPRSYYLVLADRAAANPAVEPFRHWLASQAEIAAGGTKL